jgi:glycosyltransferase involved in cell wall biosynthesis
MKILYIIDNLLRGGKERQLVELSKSLSQHHQIELVVFSKEIHYKEILTLNIKLHYLEKSDRKGLAASKKILSICKNFRPDIIHAWDHLSAVCAIPAARFYSIKLIDSIRYAAEKKRFRGNWYISDLAFGFSNVVIANSVAGLKAHRKSIDKKYRVIYNGFDLNRINHIENKEFIKQELGVSTTFTVGMVANFLKSKDYNTVITAALKILSNRNDLTFVFVGDGPTREKLEMKILEKLKPFFIFTGKRNDVEKIISIFNIGILLSNTNGHAEGISNALTEIMAQAIPVIATNAGGNPELIENNVTGFLISPFSEEELIEKLDLLLNNEELRLNMGSSAKQSITDKFGMGRMVDEYLAVYKELAFSKN